MDLYRSLSWNFFELRRELSELTHPNIDLRLGSLGHRYLPASNFHRTRRDPYSLQRIGSNKTGGGAFKVLQVFGIVAVILTVVITWLNRNAEVKLRH